MRSIDIPGEDRFQLVHLVLDLNGTLSNRGTLIDGVVERLAALGGDLEVHLVSADTVGAAGKLGEALGLQVTKVMNGDDKVIVVRGLGEEGVVAIGNGRNDAAMLRAARLGIAIIGPEGSASQALQAADIVCRSIVEALDLLTDERALVATLRS